MAQGIKEDLTGQKFGMLTVIDSKFKSKKTYYLCKCDCGNEKWIRADSIKSGKQQSCGCLRKKTQFKKNDLTGKKFGRLLAIEEVSKNKDGRYLWKCKCDCGNYTIVEGSNLIYGSTQSCGCYKLDLAREQQKVARKAHIEKNIIEDTNISVINRTKPMKHNKSGVTGVIWDPRRDKWIAEIRFKNNYYYLGRFEDKEDAIKARKEAEEKLHKKFLREKGLIE